MNRLPRSANFFAIIAAMTMSLAADEIVVRGEIGRQLHEYMKSAEAYGWSGQVLIEREGEVVLHAPYGHADRRSGRGMTLDTPIGIASISKPLTAAVILRLVEADLMALDEPIAAYLPDLADHELGSRTIDQLLSHTAGIRGGDIAGTDFEAKSKQELVQRILATPLFAAGERWRYANGGYNILAAIAEEVSGLTWETLVRQELFARVGMGRSGLWTSLPDGAPTAHAYRAWVDQGCPKQWPRNWRVFGAGDFVSTVGDLYRFEKALHTGSLLDDDMMSLMRSARASLGPPGAGYGYGWFVDEGEEGKRYEHGGDWLGGYNGLYNVLAADNLTVLILSNSRDASGMWMRQAVQKALIDIAKGDEVPMLPEARALATRRNLPGRYVSGGGVQVEILSDGAINWIAAANQSAVDFLRGVSEEERKSLESARRKTERLYAGLLSIGSAAFGDALSAEGAPQLAAYRAEWDDLIERHGALISYDVIGVVAGRSAAEYHVVLELENATIAMNGLWADKGAGPLKGTLVQDRSGTPWPFPVAIPIGEQSDGNLIAWDLFRDYGIAIEIERDGALRIRRLSDGKTIEVSREWQALAVGEARQREIGSLSSIGISQAETTALPAGFRSFLSDFPKRSWDGECRPAATRI